MTGTTGVIHVPDLSDERRFWFGDVPIVGVRTGLCGREREAWLTREVATRFKAKSDAPQVVIILGIRSQGAEPEVPSRGRA